MYNDYIGRMYQQRVCGNIVIIKVTDFEEAGQKYECDSFVGKKTIITKSGESFCEQWACCYQAFISNLEEKIIKEFIF